MSDNNEYNDDRLFLLHIAQCTIKHLDSGMVETTVYHRDPPKDATWCLVTYRNTVQHPATRVDHFDTFEQARAYLEAVEPTCPLVSLGGQPQRNPMTFAAWTEWKRQQQMEDYQYERHFVSGGKNPREIILSKQK